MDIVFGHISALEYWRSNGPALLRSFASRRSSTARARKALAGPEKPMLDEFNRRPGGCSVPVHVLVGTRAARTETSRVVSHLWSGAVSDGAVALAGDNFLMSTPEFCFLQMASCARPLELVKLGFELCGTYSLQPASDSGAIYRSASLTDASRLRSFIEKSAGAIGANRARTALRYVMDGSASPMETALAMMLCLPYRLGGYGIECPLLNHSIVLPPGESKKFGRTRFVFDMCWPEHGLACEYDSDMFHSGESELLRDARRRNALAELGYTVITVHRAQVTDAGAFNELARQLARLTGKRLCYKDPGFTRKHAELRAELFAR